MSTEIIRKARAYICEDYLQEAADLLTDPALEETESTDETARIRKQRRTVILQRAASAAAVLLVFLGVFSFFRGISYGRTEPSNMILVGTKFYYITNKGLIASNTQQAEEKVVVRGKLGAGIVHRQEKVYYTKDDAVYIYDTSNGQSIRLVSLGHAPLEIEKDQGSGPVIVRYYSAEVLYQIAVDPNTGKTAPYEAGKEAENATQMP